MPRLSCFCRALDRFSEEALEGWGLGWQEAGGLL